jgi:hypothetical protein
MDRRMGLLRRLVAVGLPLALVMATLLSGVARADDEGGTVVGAHQKFAGKTYGQWSAAWWQWAANMPASASPLVDPTGAKCGLNQAGPVWFLAGVASPTPPFTAERSCTIPADVGVLVPILNNECSSAANDCGASRNYRTLLDANQPFLQGAGGTATLDSESLPVIRAVSPPPPYPINWAVDNPFGPVTAGRAVSVADGFWVLLRPLHEGTHSLQFHGRAPAFGFTVDVTYDLTIEEE